MSVAKTVVDPNALAPQARERLVEELWALNERIFEGVERADFEKNLLRAGTHRSRLLVARVDGAAVGYAVVHVMRVGDRTVCRGLTAMLPDLRRHSLFAWFFAYEGIRLRLTRPRGTAYVFGAPVHPASYRMMVHFSGEIWPHPERTTPAHVQRFIDEMAAHFGVEPDDELPGVGRVGWRTIQPQRDAQTLTRTEDPTMRYYLARNPRYGDGYGLLMVVPVRLRSVASAVVKILHKRWRSHRTTGASKLTGASR